ncbi:hypothetical protein ACTXT7_011178 [Hymenolepis weldensis]
MVGFPIRIGATVRRGMTELESPILLESRGGVFIPPYYAPASLRSCSHKPHLLPPLSTLTFTKAYLLSRSRFIPHSAHCYGAGSYASLSSLLFLSPLPPLSLSLTCFNPRCGCLEYILV